MSGISLFVLCTALAVFTGNQQQPRTRNLPRMTAPSRLRSRSLLLHRTRPRPTGGYTTPLTI